MWLAPLALGLLECTVVTSKTGYQCTSITDCNGRGSAFAATVCRDGICQAVVAPPSPSPVCSSNYDCSFLVGGAARCIEGTCHKFPCDVRGDVTDEQGILFGVLHPSTPGSVGVDATQTLPVLLGDLADQWNKNVDSLEDDGVRVPHAGLLVCDEGNIDDAARNFQDFHVKAIVGPLTEPALFALRKKTDIPILSPVGDSPTFKEIASTDQPWFCSSNLADAVEPFANLIKKVASATAVDRGHPSTVVLAYNGWSDGEATFSQRTKAALADDLPVVDIDVNTDLTKVGRPHILQAAQIEIRTRKPDIVVMTGAAWARALVNDVELRWPGGTRPVYVVMRTLSHLDETLRSRDWPRKVYALDVAREGKMVSNYGAMLTLLAGDNNAVGTAIPLAAAAYNDCLLTAFYGAFKAQVANNIPASSLARDQVELGVASAGGTGSGEIHLTTVASDFSIGVGLLRTSASQTQLIGANAIYGFNATTHVPIATVTPYCLSATATGARADNWRRIEFEDFKEGSGASPCP